MSTSVSSVASHFPSPQNGFTTTLASTIASGAATVPLNSVAGYTNAQIGVFVVDPTDASKKQTFTGVIDTAGVQVTSVVWTAGTNQTHSAGSTVVDYATATHIAMMSKGIQVEHAQAGTHAAATVTSRTEDTTPASNDFILTYDTSATALKKVQLANVIPYTNKISNPYKFSVYRNAALTPAGSAVLACDTKEYDTGTNVDIVTNKGRFTAPIAGFYHFNAQINTGNNRALIMLYKNGSELKRGSDLPGAAGGTGAVLSVDVSAAANDYFEIFCNTGSSALTVGSAISNYFQGSLMSAT